MLSLWFYIFTELIPTFPPLFPAFSSKKYQCSGVRKRHQIQAVLSLIQASTNWDVTRPVFGLWLSLTTAIIGVSVIIWWLAAEFSAARGSLVTM